MGIFDFWHRFRRQHDRRMALDTLAAEVDRNLESYYVMFQINRRRSFQLERWQAMASFPEIVFDEVFLKYVRAIEVYQTVFKEFQDYEQWYTSDPDRKTKENGQLLHAKKEAVEQAFSGLEAVIKSAREQLVMIINAGCSPSAAT